MKVILTRDVQNLGSAGDIKDVADGFARNFLIPGGYAQIATKATIIRAEELKKQKALQSEEDFKKAQELAAQLEGVSVSVSAKTDDSGKLYAALKTEEISKALKNKGFEVDSSKIVINEPIKEAGEREFVIDLDHGLEVRAVVIVEAQK